MFLLRLGRHLEEQLSGERARPGKRRRCLRGADGRHGCRLRDRGLRVRVEEPESSHRGAGEWREIAHAGRSRSNHAGNHRVRIRRHAARPWRDLPWHTARIYQLMLARRWSSSLMVSIQKHSGLIARDSRRGRRLYPPRAHNFPHFSTCRNRVSLIFHSSLSSLSRCAGISSLVGQDIHSFSFATEDVLKQVSTRKKCPEYFVRNSNNSSPGF